MRDTVIVFGLFMLIYLCSCTKEESLKTQNVFIKTIPSDSNVATVGSFQMQDGNFIVVSRDMRQIYSMDLNPGTMIKLHQNGKVILKKRLSPLNRVLWKVLAIPGTGFVTLGYSDPEKTYAVLCMYDNDGNLLFTKNIQSNITSNPIYDISMATPWDIIPLKNGNYAIAGGARQTFDGMMKVLNPSFNILYARTYSCPVNYMGYFIRGMCEMPDSTIALTVSTAYFKHNMAVLKTSLTAVKKSFTVLYDSINDETPNGLVANNSSLLSVSARMLGSNGGNGTLVNYFNNDESKLISGMITLNHINSAGQLISRDAVSGYPLNGMINSIKPTSDGGYILCGTVNQSNNVNLVSDTKIFLLKLDANGNEQWRRIIGTTYPAYGIDAFQTLDGGYFVCGHQQSFNDHYETLVIKTDAMGNM